MMIKTVQPLGLPYLWEPGFFIKTELIGGGLSKHLKICRENPNVNAINKFNPRIRIPKSHIS
jgi:hypothetical protein